MPAPPSPPVPILHLEPDLMVVDKPAGLACHPGPRTPHSLEALLPALARAIGQRRPPVIMHRLDRDTSGCLLLARTQAGRRHIARALETGAIAKTYLALLEAPPAQETGEIDAPLRKVSSAATGWRMVIDPAGAPARTRWTLLDRMTGLVALMPLTGRTHQLRVHATCLGTAIRGDRIYGSGRATEPLRLHARRLDIPSLASAKGNTISILSPCPQGWPQPPPGW